MADVRPFQGICYNPEKIKDLSQVTAPPYDVISPQQQERFYQCHPQNVIRLILGKSQLGDCGDFNCHTRAADCFRQWLESGVLVEDSSPAFYLTAVDFSAGGQRYQRFGLIARVRLEPFENGIILPHERTYSGIKSERLALMKQCHANFSPIFSLYPDPDDLLGALKDAVAAQPPETDFSDSDEHRHQLWRIQDKALCDRIQQALSDPQLFIADGHHRYETALVYRDWVAARTPDFGPEHPANFIMMSLTSLKDPGLRILPAHRLVCHLRSKGLSALIPECERYFEVRSFGEGGPDPDAAAQRMTAALEAEKQAIGVAIKDRPAFYLLSLKPGVMAEKFPNMAPALRELDVTVLTQLILEEVLGFDRKSLDDPEQLRYSSSAAQAIRRVRDGDAELAFLLNPTRIRQVREVARQGLTMPRKSTYFYPKVLTGQVFNRLN